MSDIDDLPSPATLEQAITVWAADANRLAVVLISATGLNVFDLNATQSINGSNLDDYLDNLQAGPNNTAISGFPKRQLARNRWRPRR